MLEGLEAETAGRRPWILSKSSRGLPLLCPDSVPPFFPFPSLPLIKGKTLNSLIIAFFWSWKDLVGERKEECVRIGKA